MNDLFGGAHFCVFPPHGAIGIKALALVRGSALAGCCAGLVSQLMGLAQAGGQALHSTIFSFCLFKFLKDSFIAFIPNSDFYAEFIFLVDFGKTAV